MKGLIALTVLAVGLLPTLASAGTASTVTLKTTMSGGVEVPKGSPTGKGTATITITGSKVCWKFTYSGIDKPLASHIHKAPAGKAGAIVVPFGGAFKPSGCTTASSASLAKAIAAHPSSYYVYIHTKKYSAGAIRGQLRTGSGY